MGVRVRVSVRLIVRVSEIESKNEIENANTNSSNPTCIHNGVHTSQPSKQAANSRFKVMVNLLRDYP